MNKRLKEILERKQEIRNQLNGGQDFDFETLNNELDELDKEEREIQNRQNIEQRLNNGTIAGNEIEVPSNTTNGTSFRSNTWSEVIEGPEYRNAWLKSMMDVPLTSEERSILDKTNMEYRDFTHTTTNSQVLIPKTVAAGIWRRAEEVSSLWNDVNPLRVKGDLTMITGGRSEKAQWYDESTKVVTDELAFGQLDLKGNELAKAIQVTWKLKKMSVADFEAYIIRELGEKMGEALSYGVYAGKGRSAAKPEPLGIKTALKAEEETPQVLAPKVSGELAYTDLTKLMSMLHSAYSKGATIYASNSTIWNVLANLVDGMNRPLFTVDPMSEGNFRIFGLTVKEDIAIPNGELLVGNVSQGYAANINEDITMYTEDHVRERLTDYMAYAIVDGAPIDTKAFVLLEIAPTV